MVVGSIPREHIDQLYSLRALSSWITIPLLSVSLIKEAEVKMYKFSKTCISIFDMSTLRD